VSAAAQPIAPRDVALLLGVNLLWGSTYAVARGALDTTPPLLLAFLRFALTAVVMLALRSHVRQEWTDEDPDERRRVRLSLVVMGVVGFALAKLLNYEGLARSTATDAALLVNLEAVFMALLGVAMLRQRLHALQWLGVAVACAGGIALVAPAEGSIGLSTRVIGNLLIILSVAAEALASVLGARALTHYSGLQVTAYGTYWGALTLLPLALWQWHGAGWTTIWVNAPNLAAILYLALGATLVGYWIWYRVLGRVEAGRVAAFLYVQPVVGVALGVLLRGEWPTPAGWAGGGLVLAGIWLASRPARKS
jgi:drug/metabolite transporter (DMT)-like permease